MWARGLTGSNISTNLVDSPPMKRWSLILLPSEELECDGRATMGLPKLGHAGDTRASAKLSGRAFGALWPLCPRDCMEKLGRDRCQMGLSWANPQLFESFQRLPRDIEW